MKVLNGCEESQAVTIAMRELGIQAYSCDKIPCSGGHSEWHLQGDVEVVIKSTTWDIIILFPPCTYMACSGNRWYSPGKPEYHKRISALKWTNKLWKLALKHCSRVALENPQGCLKLKSELKYYIQPYQFGHGEQKKTCLWTVGLPQLEPTWEVSGREQRIWKMPPGKDRSKERSKTYPGIAKAMAEQWGNLHQNLVTAQPNNLVTVQTQLF